MRLSRLVCPFLCVAASTISLLAQSPNGNINGLVSDPGAGAIIGAEIVAVNDVTGVQYTTKTNSEGIYVLPNLPPGPYRLQVAKIGFKTIIKPDIVLNVQDALSVNFTLPIGAALETVTVEGGASMVNTTDASVSTVVDQAYVKNMPLNGRSFQDLILLTPGIVTQSPQTGYGTYSLGQTGEFSVNGQRTESNYYSVDGVSANVGAAAGGRMVNINGGSGPSGSIPAATTLGTTQALVSVDDLQEFRVQSSTYSAEYGRNPGGQFSFETKSGTNQWHGTAYDYLRNDYFDAQDWFNNYFGVKGAALRQNDFGGTVGGPVRIPGLYAGKDKTFFFVSYEGLRLAAPQPVASILVPDATLRANTAAPLNRVLNAFPVPSPEGIDDTANGIAQFIGTWSNPASLDSTSVRFDHVVNGKLRVFFRFSDTASRSATRVVPTNSTNAYTFRTYTAGASSVFSNRLSNEFRLNYSTNEAASNYFVDAFGGNTPADPGQLTGLAPGSQTVVALSYGPYFIPMIQASTSGDQRQWNLVDTGTLSLGRHLLKLGLDYRRLAPVALLASPSAFYYYLSKNDVEANSSLYGVETFAPAYPLYKNFSAFAQDEWKVSQRLSLSLGLRWDVNPPPGVTRGLKPYTVQFQGSGPDTWTLAPQGKSLWQTTWYNFAPRVGAAYILHDAPGHETVVRGGAGVFYDTGQQLGSGGFAAVGLSATSAYCFTCPFPGNPSQLTPAIANPPVPPYSPYMFGFSTHLQLPYTLQWNASAEQGLGKSQSLTISYVGSHAARLLQQNQFRSSVNPVESDFYVVQNGLKSDYESLQIQFRRRLSRGLTMLASYTWSHCLDYGSANFSIGYKRGNCDFDVRHNLSVAFSYDLPNTGHNGFGYALLNHWGIDDRFTARSAFPVNTDGGTSFDLVTKQQMATGADLVAGQPIYLYGSSCNSTLQSLHDLKAGQVCPGGRAINPCAFVVHGTTPGAPCFTSGMVPAVLGLAPRNFARGFGAWQMDLAVRRDFPIYERLRLQFRAEAFNIFNHPNFGTINTALGQSTFGQATSTLANSLAVLNPLYQMGGPRSMQFALKLNF